MKKAMQWIAALSCLLTILSVVVYIQTRSPAVLPLCITLGTIAYHFVMRLAVGLAFQIGMKNRADYHKSWYRQKHWEGKLYDRLRVRRWKGKLPTYESRFFDPKIHTWEEIAQAMCQAELVHESIVLLSFLPLAASIWFGEFPVFLITSLAAAALDLLFVILQRYNRPRVVRLAERMRGRNRAHSNRECRIDV